MGFGIREIVFLEGGTIGGNIRKEVEEKSGREIVNARNFKSLVP